MRVKSALANTEAAVWLLATAAAAQPTHIKGYAPVNGLRMYYEVHGDGSPIVVIHGGFMSTDLLGPIVPALAKSHMVITLDLQGHGRTADIDRPLHFESMADDVSALVKYLHIERADVLGYSFGGEVALQTAIRHPEIVRRLIIVSSSFKSSGWYDSVRQGMHALGPASAEMMKPTPFYKSYARVAPTPADWPRLHMKYHDLMTADFDWTKQVAGLMMPTMLVLGDADAIKPSHFAQFFELLGGGLKDGGQDGSGITRSRLAILPGLTHYNILSSPQLVSAILPFLDGS